MKFYEDEIPLFCSPNKYGYRLNVNHPLINKIYKRYKKKNNIARRIPLSDKQRLEFEQVTLDYLKEKGIVGTEAK